MRAKRVIDVALALVAIGGFPVVAGVYRFSTALSIYGGMVVGWTAGTVLGRRD